MPTLGGIASPLAQVGPKHMNLRKSLRERGPKKRLELASE